MFDKFLYLNYYRSARFRIKSRQWFTPGGWALLFALVAAACLGIDTNLAMAYQAFALIMGFFIVGFFTLPRKKPQLSVERLSPRYASVGAPFNYIIALANHGSKAERDLALLDEFADALPTLQEFVGTKEPGEDRRNLFDRTFKVYRWRWLVARNFKAQSRKRYAPQLGPGERAETVMELLPVKRGVLRFESVEIARPDVLGLYHRFFNFPSAGRVTVLPRQYNLPRMNFPGKVEYQPGGVTNASSLGNSEEFVALRDYRYGDPLRRVDWKTSCRANKLIVREYQEEFFMRYALILDTFADMHGFEQIFEEAVSMCASFLNQFQNEEALVDLMFVGPEAYCFTGGRAVSQIDHLLEILAEVQLCTDKPFSELTQLVLRHLSQLSGTVCVFIHWDAEREAFLEKLQALNIPFQAFLIQNSKKSGLIPPPFVRVLKSGKIQEDLAKL